MTRVCLESPIAKSFRWAAPIYLYAYILVQPINAFAEVTRDKVAEICRFDLQASSAVGSLTDGYLLDGNGKVSRQDWLPVESQDCTYVIHAAVNHYSWTDISFRFVPERDASLLWQLSGKWLRADPNTLIRQVVEWREARVDGATMTTQLESSVTSWHDNPRSACLTVKGRQAVILRIKARAVAPPDLKEMPRIESTDTPAHRAMARFRRGVSLGNNLESPRGADWGAWYTPADFRNIAIEGFDHVRIPVAWHEYTGPAPMYKLNGPIFMYLDRILNMALTNNLSVIINVQHFSSFMANPEGEAPHLQAIWEQIGARYSKAPNSVAFELLNEPNSNAVTRALNPIYNKVIRAIRKTNPDRTIFVDTGDWSSPAQLPYLWLPDWDSNIVVSIHSYEPYIFTHQGAPWALPYASTTNMVYPGPPATPLKSHPACEQMPSVTVWLDRYNTLPPEINPCSVRQTRQAISQAKDWSEYYGRPVHIGEFGCYSQIDPLSRAQYMRDMRTAIEQAGIGWAIWDWKAGFRYWNPSTMRPMPGLHQALFGK